MHHPPEQLSIAAILNPIAAPARRINRKAGYETEGFYSVFIHVEPNARGGEAKACGSTHPPTDSPRSHTQGSCSHSHGPQQQPRRKHSAL